MIKMMRRTLKCALYAKFYQLKGFFITVKKRIALEFVYNKSLEMKIFKKCWWWKVLTPLFIYIYYSICIYYSNFLPLKVSDIRLLDECIAFRLKISNKVCSFIALYRLPSQPQDEFARFLDNVQKDLFLKKLRKLYWPNFYSLA